MSTFTLDTATSRATPSPVPGKRMTVPSIRARKKDGETAEPLVMLTAYTMRMAQLLDPHCEMLLVGDSLGQVIYGILHPGVPVFETMGIVSLVALAANTACLALLWKHRAEDVNMSSVWECSRNDIASNVSVFVAAGAVWLTQSGWPDLVVGFALACLLLRSAIGVVNGAARELRVEKMTIAARRTYLIRR